MRANLRSFSKGGSVAKIDSSTAAFVKEYQERFEKKLRESEIEIIGHWRAQLEKVIASRPDSIASLLTQVQKVSEMMSNRIKVLKKG